jgi:hypothetical protein
VLELISAPDYQYESQHSESPSLRTYAIVRQLHLWKTIAHQGPWGRTDILRKRHQGGGTDSLSIPEIAPKEIRILSNIIHY